MKRRYKYKGRVLVNNSKISGIWESETIAQNKNTAKNNIIKNFIKEYKLNKKIRIYLIDDLIELENVL